METAFDRERVRRTDTRRPNLFSGRFVPLWFLLPAMLVLLILQVYPTIYAFILSVMRQRRGGFEFVGLQNFQLLLGQSTFRESFGRTLIFSAWYIVLVMGLGLLVALLMNRRVKYTSWYLVAIFIPWVLSDVVAGTMWRWMFLKDYGLIQQWLTPLFGPSIYVNPDGAMGIVILASVWRAVAFTAVLFLGALQTVPREVEESAALDGANRFQIFLRMIFPLLRHTFLIALLLTSMRSINTVGLILATTRGGPGYATTTASVYLYRSAWGESNFARGAAVSVLLFLANVVITIIYLWLITDRNQSNNTN
ncbi:MAG: sugar ABC transporter permease [Anaerolineae bacterium]|nr:sugar ABC transporter permease [Anaerolineae bacterium]